MSPRKEFRFRGCVVSPERLDHAILVGCNFVNRYLQVVWRVTFPDKTWCRVGTHNMARSYVDSHLHQHMS